MKLLLIKVVLTAIAFAFILPMIPGISFHGNFMSAILISIIFGLMLWITDIVAVALSAIVTISSFGLALLWLIPLWILGFWLIPAIALRAVADFMPSYITVAGWTPAILGGLIMLFIGMVTNSSSKLREQS